MNGEISNSFKNNYKDLEFTNLLLANLKSWLNYERFSKTNLNDMFNNKKIKLPSKISGGFRGYEVFLVKEEIDSNQYENVKNCVQELLNSLDDKKVYRLLCSVVNKANNTTASLQPKSILVTKTLPVEVLTKILIQHMIVKESKFNVYYDYLLIVQGLKRVWLSKKDIINNIKSKLYKIKKKNDLEKEILIE